MSEQFKATPNEEKESDASLKINNNQEESETSKIEIISSIGSEGRKISEKEINKSKRFIKNMEEIKDIKERKEKGELLSTVEVARLKVEEIRKKENNAEIIELTDIVSDEEMDYYRKMPETDLDQLYNESKQFLEDSKNKFNKKYLKINKRIIGIIEKVKEEESEKPDEIIELDDVVSGNGNGNENQNEQINHWANLENARTEYIREHQEFLRGGRLGKLRNALGLSPSKGKKMPESLVEAQSTYKQAKQLYAQNEWSDSSEKISSNLSVENRNKAEAEIQNRIYNIVVLDEIEHLQEKEAETFPATKKGFLMKSYERWSGLGKTKRLIYSTVMIAGLAGYASLAIPVTAGAAAIGIGGVAGKKLLRGTFGTLMSGLTGKVYDKATQGKKDRIEQTATNATEISRKNFNISNLTEIEKQYQETIKREQKSGRNLILGKALTMGVVGAGSTIGIGMLDNALAGEIPDTEVKQTPNSLAKTNSELTQNHEPSPKIDPTKFIETAQKGDSIWKMTEDQLNKHYGERFSGLEEAQKTYLIDAIKDKVAKNPTNFGMTNANNLKIDQEIDFSKAFDDESEINKFFEKTNGLSNMDKENILSTNQNIKGLETEVTEPLETETKIAKPLTGAEIDSNDSYNSAPEETQKQQNVVSEKLFNTKVNDNLENRLSEIGKGHRSFGFGSNQFMENGGEWDKLKDLKVQEVTKEGFDYYGKGALNKAVNGATQDNLKGLDNYLKEAHQKLGEATTNESVREYLRRYEVKLNNENQIKNNPISV